MKIDIESQKLSEEAIARFNAVSEKCHAALKEDRIKFTTETSTYMNCSSMSEDIVLYIGSFEAYIMIECGDEEVIVTFHDGGDESVYDDSEEITDPAEWDPSGGIQQLIDFVKQKAKAEARIAALVEKIEEICEEAQLDVEDYIIVTKSFD